MIQVVSLYSEEKEQHIQQATDFFLTQALK